MVEITKTWVNKWIGVWKKYIAWNLGQPFKDQRKDEDGAWKERAGDTGSRAGAHPLCKTENQHSRFECAEIPPPCFTLKGQLWCRTGMCRHTRGTCLFKEKYQSESLRCDGVMDLGHGTVKWSTLINNPAASRAKHLCERLGQLDCPTHTFYIWSSISPLDSMPHSLPSHLCCVKLTT